MKVWQQLEPFEDAVEGLNRLKGRYRLVGLSNGEQWFLEHLAKNRIRFDFDAIISVEKAEFFKPHPAVYRTAARILGVEPGEIMMVASHSFDIMGARACGFRGAYVNRYGLPFDETPFQPDLTLADFHQLADYLLEGVQPSLPDTMSHREE
jgi:2-haloacid dehalogenase